MKLINNWLIGTDFEFFLQNSKTKEIISAEGIIKGSKYEPFNFDTSDPFALTSLDNVLAEACIAPTNECKTFVSGINKSMDYIRSILPKGICIASIPSATLKDEWLQTDNAKLFGCEGDYNVWTRSPNPKPVAENQNLRSAGFHIHTSYDNPDISITEKIIKAYDLFEGVPSVLLEPENERRKLYGKAGAFRIKDYGLEYRSLSGYFTQTDELKKFIFENAVKAIDFVNDGRSEEIESVSDQIQMAINTGDKVIAGNLIRQFEIPMP